MWSLRPSVTFLDVSGWVSGHSGMLGGWLIAFSTCARPIFIVYLRLFGNASRHFLCFSCSFQGQWAVLQPKKWIVVLLCSFLSLMYQGKYIRDKITAYSIGIPGEKWRNFGPWQPAIKCETLLITKTTNGCGLATHKQHRHSLRDTTYEQLAWINILCIQHTWHDSRSNDDLHGQHVECLLPMLIHDHWLRPAIATALTDHLYAPWWRHKLKCLDVQRRTNWTPKNFFLIGKRVPVPKDKSPQNW